MNKGRIDNRVFVLFGNRMCLEFSWREAFNVSLLEPGKSGDFQKKI